MVMDYAMAMDYIKEKNKLGTVPGLDAIKELLRRLGNPQNKCRCLQIAGTNGKGSVFSFVQEVLLEAGFSVGRYISPAVCSYLERFQINKENMSEEMFAGLISRVGEAAAEMEEADFPAPTAFEIETAVAFLYFAGQRVDYALIECGMGGRLDATNVLDTPVLSVIASVSRDHMQFLGDSLTEIAEHKAGIIKEGSLCISAPQPDEVMEVLRSRCELLHTELVEVSQGDIDVVCMDLAHTVFEYQKERYELSILGECQPVNAAVAIETVRRIDGVTQEHICRGLKRMRWPGRMTRVGDAPLMYVDGAHNEAAWLSLKKTVNKYFTNREIIYIIGVLKDKEYDRMADILADTMSYAITVTPDTPRGLPKETLALVLADRGVEAVMAACAGDAVSQAGKRAALVGMDKSVILVCGSLSFLADYLREL